MLRSGQDVCDDRRWAFISHDLEAPRLLRNIELGGQGGLRLGHRLLSMGVYFAHTGSEKLLVGYVKGDRNATNMLGGRLRSAGGICGESGDHGGKRKGRGEKGGRQVRGCNGGCVTVEEERPDGRGRRNGAKRGKGTEEGTGDRKQGSMPSTRRPG